MSTKDHDAVVRIDLTEEQKTQIKAATDRSVDSIELTAQELEQRIAPRLAANHNETLL
ncbi:MAG TPA: hypothetical protein VFP90_14950 [Gemmatimonadaceae bacterium]|nr:hypothetical protein [Gemmatimonadaceae bacterium]